MQDCIIPFRGKVSIYVLSGQKSMFIFYATSQFLQEQYLLEYFKIIPDVKNCNITHTIFYKFCLS